MKISQLILFLILASSGFTQNVYLEHNYSSPFIVFSDNVNLREGSSIKSKIIATVPSRTILNPSNFDWHNDTINGVAGKWLAVVYNNKSCYVWSKLIAQSYFRSQINPKDRFLIKQAKNNRFEVKIYKEDVFIKSVLLPNLNKQKYNCGFSLGETYNSDGKDVFVFCFDKGSLFYQWDGKDLTRFNKELKDSSFLHYNQSSIRQIVGNSVNFRTAPSIHADVIKVLEFGSKLVLVKDYFKRDTVNNVHGYWAKVIYRKKTGYVWHTYISLYSFESYKDKSLSFIVKEGKHWHKNEILAIKDNKVIDSYSFDALPIREVHSIGNMGMQNISDFISIYFAAEVSDGNLIIAWDGSKFHRFIIVGGWGDGGFSEGNRITFPSDRNGESGIIIISNYESELVGTHFIKAKYNSEEINRKFLIRKYSYINDSLVEINSQTKIVEKLLKQYFPGFKLAHFSEGDLNNDGFPDMIINALDTLGRYNYNYNIYEKKPNKTLLLILLNDKKGGYIVKTYSKKLIYHKKNHPLSKFIITEIGFQINIYYSGYYNTKINMQYEIYYIFDTEENDFIMKKIIEYIPPQKRDGDWTKKEYNYNSKKILFEDSYHPAIDFDYPN